MANSQAKLRSRSVIKRAFTSFIFMWCVCSVSFATDKLPDEFTLLHKERIGSLRIDLPEATVKKVIPCSLKREADTLWGADGIYHQKWVFFGCGISLDMTSDKKGGPKSIFSIAVISPSILRTQRNIQIGSSRQEVINAYRHEWNKENSMPSGSFIAGSIYGGLIFNFESNKVNRIFLGAAAE